MTEGFADTHIEFGIDAGHSAQLIGHRARLGSGQTNPRIIHVNGPDTGATIRRMAACSLEGFIQLNGALDFYVVGSQFTNITTDSATGPWFVSSCRWGNGGVAMTLSGIEGHIVGNSFSGDVTLDTTFSGSFIGNAQTGGVFTNNSVVTTAIVMHHPLSASYQLLYQHTLPVGQAVPHRILHNGSVSAGDADITFSALSSQTIINYATSLTANRTVTLSTTGAVDGDRVTIFRNGGDTGGPWTVAIGGTGTNLSTNSFCVAEYNGSFWVVSHFGWLSTSIKPSSSDGSAGISTTITTASLVGKTVTVKDGLITGFA
jgi:hypothetical protein